VTHVSSELTGMNENLTVQDSPSSETSPAKRQRLD
jgi:hypothetical protein